MARRRRFLRIFVWTLLLGVGGRSIARAQLPADGFNPGANGGVYAVAVQTDGKILVGGNFTMLGGGGTGTTTRNYIGRLKADGSLDAAFTASANAWVSEIAVQTDGKILVGGSFTTLGGVSHIRIGRINSNGTIDSTFSASANGTVTALVVQADGKILVGGDFTALNSVTRYRIGRLNSDGSLDTSFDPGANGKVEALVEQPDGKILVGGWFSTLGGGSTGTSARDTIGRLTSTGAIDAAFNPGALGVVSSLALQADGKILVGGSFSGLGGGTGTTARSNIGRLTADGSVDPSFNPGSSGGICGVCGLAVQADGKIVAVGDFTTLGGGGTGTITRNYIGRLEASGSIDTTFNPGANTSVWAVALQPDGGIVVGGDFTGLGGATGTTSRNSVGRVHPDGLPDADFNPGANGSVGAIAVQPDRKIIVGGTFTTLGTSSTVRNNMGRLQSDGTVDTEFNPGANANVSAVVVQPDGAIVVGGSFTLLGGGGTGSTTRNRIGRVSSTGVLEAGFAPGANDTVSALALQADGQILVGGSFTGLGGGTGTTTRNSIGRLTAAGELDSSFDPNANGAVHGIAVQSDGKIVVVGAFTTVGGVARNRIARLESSGALDTSFNPGANGSVYAVAIQKDGSILVGGLFSMIGGGGTGATARNGVARLSADGSVDMTFDPGVGGQASLFALQVDGQIVVAGDFATFGGSTRNYVARLASGGSIDSTFDPGANNEPLALALQADGKLVIGGTFTGLGGSTGTTTRQKVGRLTNTSAAIQSLAVSSGGSVITWLRSGTAPEVGRVTFESSTDGSTYTALGSGTAISGGWTLTGQSLATNQSVWIRARGYQATGGRMGSTSIVESVRLAYVSCPTVSPTSVAAGTYGAAYSAVFSSTGAIGSVTFGRTGSLPAGLTFSAGTLSGTPTEVGFFPLTITATDAQSGCAGSQNVTLMINATSATPFTDSVLTAGSTTVRAVHITELRARIDLLRVRYGLSAFSWTDSTITAGTTLIKAVHITELRTALAAAYVASGRAAPTYSPLTITAGSTLLTAAIIAELRSAIVAIE